MAKTVKSQKKTIHINFKRCVCQRRTAAFKRQSKVSVNNVRSEKENQRDEPRTVTQPR